MAGSAPVGQKIRTRRGVGGPTIADVALAAGVSPMTVSRVVNLDGSVLPATRTRVEEAIVRLGYIPNRAARSLAGGRQCRIALVYSNPSAGYLSELLVGSVAQANASGALLVVELLEEGHTVQQLLERLRDHQVDGVLLPPPLCEDRRLIEALQVDGVRVVQISSGIASDAAHGVAMDDTEAARTVTSHLVTLGHTRIGFIEGSLSQSQSLQRRAGYEQAIREAGLTLDPELQVTGDFSYRSGLIATERLLTLRPPPTAIFASNDDMAAAAVAIAHRHGLDVPTDLSICGFDDTAMASSIWPELTTIRQPIASMARHGVKLISDVVGGSVSEEAFYGKVTKLPFELVRRASDAPPKDSPP